MLKRSAPKIRKNSLNQDDIILIVTARVEGYEKALKTASKAKNWQDCIHIEAALRTLRSLLSTIS